MKFVSIITLSTLLISAPLVYAANKDLATESDVIPSTTDDLGLTTKIMGEYTFSPLLGPFKLQVFAKGHSVALIGDLTNIDQYVEAIYLAVATDGVQQLDVSKLTVRNQQANLEDAYLKAVIQGRLYKSSIFNEKDTHQWPIQISVNEATVIISGKVDTKGLQKQIVEIVRNTEGVKSVNDKTITLKNNATIKGSE